MSKCPLVKATIFVCCLPRDVLAEVHPLPESSIDVRSHAQSTLTKWSKLDHKSVVCILSLLSDKDMYVSKHHVIVWRALQSGTDIEMAAKRWY